MYNWQALAQGNADVSRFLSIYTFDKEFGLQTLLFKITSQVQVIQPPDILRKKNLKNMETAKKRNFIVRFKLISILGGVRKRYKTIFISWSILVCGDTRVAVIPISIWRGYDYKFKV